MPDEGPVISGGFPRYTVGDRVVVNCTSRRSRPPAKLKWYINGEQADRPLVKHYKVKQKWGAGIRVARWAIFRTFGPDLFF